MLTEDLSIFFDPTGIGDTATVGGSPMYGIFEREFVEVKNVEGYFPTFLVADTDAATITKNSTVITINSVNYHAVSKRPDGTGTTRLILEKQ